jgi:hypoxanthine phosphoribosyltransferase
MSKVESFKCKIVSWEEIRDWSEALSEKIRAGGHKPTVVIGLTRGGWVPARLICDHLGVKRLYAVKTEHWGVTANPDGKALLTVELNIDVSKENVLIVDDITDTGESLTLALKHVKDMRPQELRSATLLHISHSKIAPDYYSKEVPKEDWTWFIFPWNLHEDLRTLLPKTLHDAKSVADIRRNFRTQFQIDVPEHLVQRTLEDLQAAGKLGEHTDLLRK